MIDFAKPIQTGHTPPRIGTAMGVDRDGRQRVSIRNDDGHGATAYLYRDDGSLRCDGSPSVWDLINVSAEHARQLELEDAIAARAA